MGGYWSEFDNELPGIGQAAPGSVSEVCSDCDTVTLLYSGEWTLEEDSAWPGNWRLRPSA